MRFTKMHGAGNDYVYVDWRQRVANPAALSRAVSDRHTGVGADGLILILPSRRADFRMRMFNADGSEGAMCGNGIRCIARYVHDHGLTRKRDLTIETPARMVRVRLHPGNGAVTVDMGRPQMLGTLRVGGATYHRLSMGNPHAVTFVRDVDRLAIDRVGPRVERAVPGRTNVEFVRVASPTRLIQRTWERGSGETLACGSGACASAAAAEAAGLAGRRVRVELRGGVLEVERDDAGHLWMTGPAVEVFTGEWHNR